MPLPPPVSRSPSPRSAVTSDGENDDASSAATHRPPMALRTATRAGARRLRAKNEETMHNDAATSQACGDMAEAGAASRPPAARRRRRGGRQRGNDNNDASIVGGGGGDGLLTLKRAPPLSPTTMRQISGAVRHVVENDLCPQLWSMRKDIRRLQNCMDDMYRIFNGRLIEQMEKLWEMQQQLQSLAPSLDPPTNPGAPYGYISDRA